MTGRCRRKAACMWSKLDREANRVIVGDDAELRSDSCEVRDINWISFATLEKPVRSMVKIRHRHEPAAATLEPTWKPLPHGCNSMCRSVPLHRGKRRYFIQGMSF